MDLQALVAQRREDLRSRRVLIEKASAQARQDYLLAQKEVERMREKDLPDALANFALSKITNAELARVKKRFRELNEVVSNWPLLQRGFANESGRIDAEGRQAAFLELHVVRPYVALKAEFQKGMEANLLSLAQELSKEFGPEVIEDAQAFLNSMSQGAGAEASKV